MPDVETRTVDPFAAATAAAVEDILAAMAATAHADAPTGEPVGHGTIRLRDQTAPAEPDAPHDDPEPIPADPVAATAEPVGAPAEPVGAAPANPVAAPADAIGHGTIRLRG